MVGRLRLYKGYYCIFGGIKIAYYNICKLNFFLHYIYILFPYSCSSTSRKIFRKLRLFKFPKKVKNYYWNYPQHLLYYIQRLRMKGAQPNDCTLIIKYRILKATCPRGQAGNRRRGCRRRKEALQWDYTDTLPSWWGSDKKEWANMLYNRHAKYYKSGD